MTEREQLEEIRIGLLGLLKSTVEVIYPRTGHVEQETKLPRGVHVARADLTVSETGADDTIELVFERDAPRSILPITLDVSAQTLMQILDEPLLRHPHQTAAEDVAAVLCEEVMLAVRHWASEVERED